MITPFLKANYKRGLSFFVIMLCAFISASLVTSDAFAAKIPNSAFSTSNLVVTAGDDRAVVSEGEQLIVARVSV